MQAAALLGAWDVSRAADLYCFRSSVQSKMCRAWSSSCSYCFPPILLYNPLKVFESRAWKFIEEGWERMCFSFSRRLGRRCFLAFKV